jgi:hypothetical protein
MTTAALWTRVLVRPFGATAPPLHRGMWCSSPRSVMTTYAAINAAPLADGDIEAETDRADATDTSPTTPTPAPLADGDIEADSDTEPTTPPPVPWLTSPP